MNTRELIKLIDQCDKKWDVFVFIKVYGDGSGGLYTDNADEEEELTSWDSEDEIEKTLKEWLKG